MIVREPLESLVSEYNRQAQGHTGHARDMRQLNSFISNKVRTWRKMNLDWLENFSPQQLLVVSYSQLVTDLRSQLKRMATFLNVTVTENDLNCTLQRREGSFKRKKVYQKLNIDLHNKKLVEEYKTDVLNAAIKVYSNFVF